MLLDGAGLLQYDEDDNPLPQPDSGSLTITISDAAGSLAGTTPANIDISKLSPVGVGVTQSITLQGNDGGNVLIATGASDTLMGGAGNDRLVGLGGADLLVGGDGADTYEFAMGSSRGIDNAGSFSGDTIDGFAMGGAGDKIWVEARANGALSIADPIVLDGAEITFANFGTSLGNALGTSFFDPESPLQGSQALVVTIEGGEAAGTYLVLENLRTGFAGYQSTFDQVVRLTNTTGTLSDDDFGYVRSGSAIQTFIGLTGRTDVLDYKLRADAGTTLSQADSLTNVAFGGEDVFRFASSQFGGIEKLEASNFIITDDAGADLSAADDIDGDPNPTGLAQAIAALVEANAGGSVDHPFFALVHDTDALDVAGDGVNPMTYLVYDANGTGQSGPFGEDGEPDIRIVAKFAGAPSEIPLAYADFLFL
jgi:hypothetical protein